MIFTNHFETAPLWEITLKWKNPHPGVHFDSGWGASLEFAPHTISLHATYRLC